MIVNNYKNGLDQRVNLTAVRVFLVALPFIFLLELGITTVIAKTGKAIKEKRERLNAE